MDLTWALQTATMLGVAVIGFFLKTTLAEIKSKLKENDTRISKVEENLNNLKSDLPFIYTTREDHATAMNAVDRKISDMDKKLDRLHEYASRERRRTDE